MSKEGREEKYPLSQALTDELDKKLFASLTDEITPEGAGGTRHIGANLVGVDLDAFSKDERPYEAAVREYAHTREPINAERTKRGCTFMASLLWPQDEDTRHQLESRLYPSAFFVLPEERLASFLEHDTPAFSEFCRSNKVQLYRKRGRPFHQFDHRAQI